MALAVPLDGHDAGSDRTGLGTAHRRRPSPSRTAGRHEQRQRCRDPHLLRRRAVRSARPNSARAWAAPRSRTARRRRPSGDDERSTVFLYPAQGKASGVHRKLLAVYLNDHLAGATLGLELVRRTARENRDSTLGSFLTDVLLPEIDEDRRTLQRLMGQIGIAPSRPKIAAAWLAEKLGRLKLNGELRRYSPLSRLVELEGLAVGIEGKRALWLALEAAHLGGLNGFDFQALAERAEFQRSRLEEHRLAAVTAALGEPGASALDTGA